jgi:hypothetical protein
MQTTLHQWHSPTDRKVILTLQLPAQGTPSTPVIRTPAYELTPAELAPLAEAAADAMAIINIGESLDLAIARAEFPTRQAPVTKGPSHD